MVGVEQRFTICEFAVSGQLQVDQIANRSCSGTPHCLWDGRELAQVIVDNGLAGNREDVSIGGQRDRHTAVAGGDIFVFSTFRDFIQFGKTIQTDTFSLMEIRQRTGRCPLLESFLAVLLARQHRLFSTTSQDMREITGAVRKCQVHNLRAIPETTDADTTIHQRSLRHFKETHHGVRVSPFGAFVTQTG